VYDHLIKEFQEQKRTVLTKDESLVAKQVELDWFKRLNSDKQLELDLCQDTLKRIKEHKCALEEENRYLMQVIKESAMVKNAHYFSEKNGEKLNSRMSPNCKMDKLQLNTKGLNQSLSEDNLLASFRKISQEIK
jgi:predicted  nucleic acid-binding Zn ribbon protein